MGRAGRTVRGQASRARIVAVATQRFVADGYLLTTIADIARDAEMSAQAVYLAFGSKAAILAAAYESAAADDTDRPSPIRPAWLDQVAKCQDASDALDLALEHATNFIERTGPIVEVANAVAADPEVAKLLTALTAQRQSLWQELASEFSRKTGFRRGLTVARARDALCIVVGYEPWRALTRECGWSTQEWREFIQASARAHVLDVAPDEASWTGLPTKAPGTRSSVGRTHR